jgi:hypothetical protein
MKREIRDVPTSHFSVILQRKGKGSFRKNTYDNENFMKPALMVYDKPKHSDKPCSYFVKKSSAFRIVSRVTEDLLGKADKIKLSYIK